MPTSIHSQITPILLILEHEKPTSVLDIGCGKGKYGVLIKEYIPSAKRVDAVEIFPQYITALHKAVYDHIYTEDILKMQPDTYDLYLLVDVIEHMSIEEGAALINRLPNTKVIATPLQWMPSGAENGNVYEMHRSHWTLELFAKHFPGCAVLESPSSWIAVIPYTKEYLVKNVKEVNIT